MKIKQLNILLNRLVDAIDDCIVYATDNPNFQNSDLGSCLLTRFNAYQNLIAAEIDFSFFKGEVTNEELKKFQQNRKEQTESRLGEMGMILENHNKNRHES
jgi:hypothetical protein